MRRETFFGAGATISKGINRGVGTILGGGLGFLMAFLAQGISGAGKAVVIGMSVFVFCKYTSHLPGKSATLCICFTHLQHHSHMAPNKRSYFFLLKKNTHLSSSMA